jgi:hypothetical protein
MVGGLRGTNCHAADNAGAAMPQIIADGSVCRIAACVLGRAFELSKPERGIGGRAQGNRAGVILLPGPKNCIG